MTGVRNVLNWTQSDGMAEAISVESCHIVLETSPPDYVQKISRYLESSVAQSRQDKVFDDAAEEKSDSGDSLFLTQKPVPEAVRTRRRNYYRARTTPTSPRDLEESEDDISSSASHKESKTDKKRARKKFRLPKYTFPFLKEMKRKKRSTFLSVHQNTSLHNATMGGFFKCVRELWQGYESGHDLEGSLPTLDMDGEYISPLSEGQEERSEDEDIKVVEKKRFLAPSKAKCSKPWYTPAKGDRQGRWTRRTAASQEMSLENQKKLLHKISAKASLSRVTRFSPDTDSSDDGDSSCGVLVERKTSETSILTQTETPKTERPLTRVNKKILFGKKEREEELSDDSDATFCEPPKLLRSLGDQTLRGSESDITVTETQAHASYTDNLSQSGQEEDEPRSQSLLQGHPELVSNANNDSVCNETRIKKKKKSKGDHVRVEEGKGQSQGEQEGLHAAAPVNMEADETPRPPEDNGAEASALHDDNILRQEEADIPDSTQMKKKRKKNKSAVENIRQEVDENSDASLGDSGLSVMCNMKNSDKKKRKKRGKTSVEGVEQLQSSAITAEPLREYAEMQTEKKQRKKEKRIAITEECEEEIDCLENTEASQGTLECSQEMKRPKHNNKQQSSSLEDGVDVSLSNDVNFLGHTGLKKKKKKKRESVCEGEDISYSPDKTKKVENADDQDVEQIIKKKKKKREKISETCSRNVSNDTVGQSDDPVSVRKKKKKRTSSFLDADSQENNTHWHQQQSSSPTSAADHVWCAENHGVSTGDVEPKSAEIAGNSSDGVRKKKRKKLTTQENVEEDHKPEFEEPNRTCQSAFSGSTDTELKRKKKPKRTESDSVTPMERSDSRANEGQTQVDESVVPKKKKKKKAKEELQ